MNALRTVRSRGCLVIALLLVVCCLAFLSSSTSRGANCAKQCKMLVCWRKIDKGNKAIQSYMISTDGKDPTKNKDAATCNPAVTPGYDRYSVFADTGTCQDNKDKSVYAFPATSTKNCDNEPKPGAVNAFYEDTSCA